MENRSAGTNRGDETVSAVVVEHRVCHPTDTRKDHSIGTLHSQQKCFFETGIAQKALLLGRGVRRQQVE
jgi:hypothetical protein